MPYVRDIKLAAFAILTVMLMTMLATSRAEAQVFNIERLVMPGPVIQAHASIEESCDSCHVSNPSETQDALCGSCHIDVQRDRATGDGYHGLHPDAASSDCFSCHQEHEGRNAEAVQFSPAAFDHAFTDFPLIGLHTQLECADCHNDNTPFRQTSQQCSSCHQDQDVHMGVLGETCTDCHSPNGWDLVAFDHSLTMFSLRDAHAEAQCIDCHRDQTFVGTPLRCASCHRDDDVHNGRNGTECADCHSETAWNATNFNHWMVSGFALEGRHQSLDCQSCHTTDLTAALPQTCVGCHAGEDIHQGALGEDCASCHTPNTWSGTGFDHFSSTGFDLTGAHAQAQCSDCHATTTTAALPTDCAGCHTPDPHQGQLGADCAGCHGDLAWNADVLFDHGLTDFPLIGVHAQTGCIDCHATAAFHDAGEDCMDCHVEDDYHAGTLGDSCAGCHSPVAWQAWMFDHSEVSQFPLTGAHGELGCASCHQQDLDAMLADGTTCASCHRHEDPHDGRFGTDCGSCHTTENF